MKNLELSPKQCGGMPSTAFCSMEPAPSSLD